jgi:phosphoenolpyruvate carboxylase
MFTQMRWEETVKSLATQSGISANLQQWIHLLSELLEQVITEQEDERLLEPLGQLPILTAKAFHDKDPKAFEQLRKQLASFPLPVLVKLLRLYTTFFHLVNSMEQHEITGINRQRAFNVTDDKPRSESIADAIFELKNRGLSWPEVKAILQKLDIQPTITAHPTEARRFSILIKQQHITAKISSLSDNKFTQAERQGLIGEILNELALLLATDEVRSERLTVEDEVENGLFYFTESIWKTIPSVYSDLKLAVKTYYDVDLEVEAFLKYRSWIGSDRDGNPSVTSEVSWETALKHRRCVLELYKEELRLLLRYLSVSDKQVTIPVDLGLSLEQDEDGYPLAAKYIRHYRHEPYRRKIAHIMLKLDEQYLALDEPLEVLLKKAKNYKISDFISDLQLIKRCLVDSGLPQLAKGGPLTELIIRAKTFGFHLAAMDIRQHSALHEQTVSELLTVSGVNENYADLDEQAKVELLTRELINPRPLRPVGIKLASVPEQILAVFEITRRVQQLDANLMGSYIISMTHGVSDMLEVLLIAKEVGLWRLSGDVHTQLDVCPLFETVEDLEESPRLMKEMFSSSIYSRHLVARANFQEIMLGYSDSNKDGGYWMANWALQKAQHGLGKACNESGIDFRLFHGRGGSVGRGGGRSNRAILSLPTQANNGRIRFTEQGEVLSFRYSLPAVTHRHLEQIVHAMLMGTSNMNNPSDEYLEPTSEVYQLMETLAKASMKTYHGLIHDETFWNWYTGITPIEHISRLPIASRPVSRTSGKLADFSNLRAIPWVFAWTQLRYNVPGWFGTGAALDAVMKEQPENVALLQKMYEGWDFFITVLDNVQRELVRTHLDTARIYNKSENDRANLHSMIVGDFGVAQKRIVEVTKMEEVLGKRSVILNSIEFRNPYTYTLNFMQKELMDRWQKVEYEHHKEPLRHALFLSINGIAAAMQSTG